MNNYRVNTEKYLQKQQQKKRNQFEQYELTIEKKRTIQSYKLVACIPEASASVSHMINLQNPFFRCFLLNEFIMRSFTHALKSAKEKKLFDRCDADV